MVDSTIETNLPAECYSIRLHGIQKHNLKIIKESERQCEIIEKDLGTWVTQV